MNKDELLQEARRRYPVGTKFTCSHMYGESWIFTVHSELYWQTNEGISLQGIPYLYNIDYGWQKIEIISGGEKKNNFKFLL